MRLVILLALLPLGACSALQGALRQGTDCSPDVAANPAAIDVRSQSAGVAAATAGRLQAYVGSTPWPGQSLETYQAASGRQCERVAFQAPNGIASTERVICQSASGWYLVEPLRAAPGAPQLTLRSSTASSGAGATYASAKNTDDKCGKPQAH